MNLPFTKMTGAGNDFVVIDNRDGAYTLSGPQIERVCDRRFGVGADGLLAVEAAANGEADFTMRYYNADGGEAEMCGNGARCFARFVRPMAAANANAVSFTTPAGLIRGRYLGDDIEVNLTPPTEVQLNKLLDLDGEQVAYHFANTGVPHVVEFVDDIEAVNVVERGCSLRQHDAFSPAGTNINFAQITGDQSLSVRTYERGVEDETLACGTGVTAVAIVAHLVHHLPLPLDVLVRGEANLGVNFTTRDGGDIDDVTLRGPAEACFQGSIEI